MSNFTRDSGGVTAYGKPVKMGVVNAARLNIRRSPDASQETNVLGVLKNFDEVYIIKENATPVFMKVRTKSGIEGFVMKKYIRVLP